MITTFVQGVESKMFPGAPLDYLVPGDPLPNGDHIRPAIGLSPLDNFSPRLGIAYSPDFASGLLGKLTGGPGKTSIRAGAGRFFTAVEGLTIAYPTGNPPYGLTYPSPESPGYALCCCADRHELCPAVPRKRSAIHGVANKSRYKHRLVAVHPSEAREACFGATKLRTQCRRT
jgi:hypothetical protein